MIKLFEEYKKIDPYGEEIWDDRYYFIGNILVSNEKISEGDFIIDIEKLHVIINGENMNRILKCVKILHRDLVWETIDGKEGACDPIYQFKKVIV